MTMNAQLAPLIYVSLFTALLWVPYVLNRLLVGGVEATFGYPAAPAVLSPWATRLRAAHANAIENLVVFAVLVLAAQVSRVSTPIIATAGWLYLSARILHAVAYALGVPWLRTLAFGGGFIAQMMVAWQLVGIR